MTDDNDNPRAELIDKHRSRSLWDVGGNGYDAVTTVAADGTSYLVVARTDAIDETTLYDPTCYAIKHEQLGELPPEFLRRIAMDERNGTDERPGSD